MGIEEGLMVLEGVSGGFGEAALMDAVVGAMGTLGEGAMMGSALEASGSALLPGMAGYDAVAAGTAGDVAANTWASAADIFAPAAEWAGGEGAMMGAAAQNASTPWWSSLSMGNVKDALQVASPVTSIYSGMKALSLADQQKRLATLAAGRADPWGTSGGRAAADAQLQELNRDPSAAMAKDPRYAAMLQAAQRATAVQGQDSGAMAAAGAQAGGNWYSQRMAELSGLAGANVNPASGAQVEMSGLTASNDLYSKGLASIGYGTQRFAGATMPPEVLQWLRTQGINA